MAYEYMVSTCPQGCQDSLPSLSEDIKENATKIPLSKFSLEVLTLVSIFPTGGLVVFAKIHFSQWNFQQFILAPAFYFNYIVVLV